MKIKVESEKIIKAVKNLDGVEIVVENSDDAKEAINLILRKTRIFDSNDSGKLRDFKVSAYQKYETSAVDYKMIFLLEFFFEEDVSLDSRITVIKGLQEFFDKV
jgi:copper chaperone CopZ